MKLAQLQYYDTSFTSSKPATVKDETGLVFVRLGIVSGTLSILILVLIVYSLTRIKALDKEESAMKKALIKKHYYDKEDMTKNPRWTLVEEMIQSNVESDWKLAIIESDILLEEAMRESGFEGDTLGEMLTNATKNSFNTYNSAWEAHHVRNEIAHSGTSHKLSKDEAIRVINMYRAVLTEFSVI